MPTATDLLSRDAAPIPGAALKLTSTAHQLSQVLRSRIIALDLPPGVQLSRADLAAAYGVSQTPVRDALQMLEQEGLVIVYPQSRTEVTRIDVGHARETQFLRVSLELEVVRTLCGLAGAEAVDRAGRILKQQEAALAIEGDLDRFNQLDRLFHRSMFEAAGVADLWELIQTRSGHIDRLRKLNLMDPGKAATIIVAHTGIIDRIRARDVAGAQDAVRHHLSGTLSQVEEIRAAHAHFF